MRQSGSSFYWAMRLLPEDQRIALFGVYAFCRAVDDIADGPLPAEDKLVALEWWRREVEGLFEGEAHQEITRVLVGPVTRYGLDKRDFMAVIDGMAMDAWRPMVAPSEDDLAIYCDRVAGAVGRLCVHIFGEPGPEGQRTASRQGLALQLTNILRDLDEDAAQGRLYLPRELLAAHGIEGREPQSVLGHPALPAACDHLARRAVRAFAEARDAMAACSHKRMRPARIMMAIYHRTLERLMRRGWQNRSLRASPGGAEKLWIALRHGF